MTARLLVLLVLVLGSCSLRLLPNANAGPATETHTGVDAASLHVPLGKGLPVMVRAGVYFVEIEEIDEDASDFVATIDLRLRWEDSRLRYAAEQAPRGFIDLRDEAADARIAEIWTPDVSLANIEGEPAEQRHGLRVYPDGRVELMRRVRGRFKMTFDFERFPFDRQKLQVELVARRDTTDVVVLDHRQDDLSFTRVAEDLELQGWTAGLMDFRRAPLIGWHGESHSRLWVSLEVARNPGKSIAAIFIPLFASLCIPVLAIWLNKIHDGVFEIPAFELANMVIGGLFAVIALNFTVSADYPALAAADNTVARLFVLDYLLLGVSLVVNLVLFRFNVMHKLFGRHVQQQVYLYLVWALPVLALGTAVAIVLVAMV